MRIRWEVMMCDNIGQRKGGGPAAQMHYVHAIIQALKEFEFHAVAASK